MGQSQQTGKDELSRSPLEAGGGRTYEQGPRFHAPSTEHRELAEILRRSLRLRDQRRRDHRNFLINEVVDGAVRNGIFIPAPEP